MRHPAIEGIMGPVITPGAPGACPSPKALGAQPHGAA